jgi:hypothetical protein
MTKKREENENIKTSTVQGQCNVYMWLALLIFTAFTETWIPP